MFNIIKKNNREGSGLVSVSLGDMKARLDEKGGAQKHIKIPGKKQMVADNKGQNI